MSINFVKTAVLSSEDGLDFNKEEATESEAACTVRQAKEAAGNKSLYEQLANKAALKQAEYDENKRKLFASHTLDEDDIQYLEEQQQQKKQRLDNIKAREEEDLKKFKNAVGAADQEQEPDDIPY